MVVTDLSFFILLSWWTSQNMRSLISTSSVYSPPDNDLYPHICKSVMKIYMFSRLLLDEGMFSVAYILQLSDEEGILNSLSENNY